MNNLKSTRLAAGQSQADAAKLIGISLRQLIRLENGESTPRELTRQAVERYIRKFGERRENDGS